AGLILGCSKTSAKTKAADEQASAETADSESAPATPAKDQKAAGRKKKSAKSPGAHIGEIPLDAWPEVWFKDPLSVAAEKAATRAEVPATKATAAPETSIGGAEAPSRKSAPDGSGAKSGATDWAALISGEDLADEAKAARSSLTDKLQSVGKYSGNYKSLR